jgi:hypothetical protein
MLAVCKAGFLSDTTGSRWVVSKNIGKAEKYSIAKR